MLASLTTFLGLPLTTLLPVIAQDVFQGDAGLYSRMMAFAGAGSVTGALLVAWLGSHRHMGLTLLLMQIAFGAFLAAFSFSRVLWLSEVLLFFAAATIMVVTATTTSLVQLIAPDHLRGRVVSIYMVAFRGGMPLGSLASGSLATVIGAPSVLTINGALVAVVAAYFLVRSHGVRDL